MRVQAYLRASFIVTALLFGAVDANAADPPRAGVHKPGAKNHYYTRERATGKRHYYTRKRVNGKWITGRFYYKNQRSVMAKATVAKPKSSLKRRVVRASRVEKGEWGTGSSKSG